MIYNNAIVTKNAAYRESGALIEGTQRISLEQPQTYWQQSNLELTCSINQKPSKTIKTAIYVGRIPLHFGHFLIEGLPKLHQMYQLDFPYIGYITKGFLPEGIKHMPEEQARKILNLLSSQKFYEIDGDESILVENMIFSKPPLTISHTVHDPLCMSQLTTTLAQRCNDLYNLSDIEILKLNRYEDEIESYSNNPEDELSLQIAKVYNAKKLIGNVGSNTHLSMFAKSICITDFKYRNEPTQTDRNQYICELIRTYNI